MHIRDVQYAGKSAVQLLAEGMFLIDANIELLDTPTMEVIKSSNKRIVEIGDAITYTVEVRNLSVSATLSNVKLRDDLPLGFVFASNTARLDSASLPNPLDRRKLEWLIADSLAPGNRVRVSYSVTVGSGALDGNGINTAYALANDISGGEQRSLDATVQVTVRPGVFTDRGIVVGKVFYDENENGTQDESEHGIPGVELWMEDGTRIRSGDEGKYSLPEVRAGQHVMRVNDLSLPYGAELLALKSEFAEDGLTRFVRLSEGGIARTDFYVRPPRQASAEVTFAARAATRDGERIPALYALNFGEIGTPTHISLVDTLPDGFSYDYKSISWREMKLYPEGVASRFLSVDFQKREPHSSDSIRVDIIADSGATGKALTTRGKLLLAYPRGRDALFSVTQKFGAETLPLVVENLVIEGMDSVQSQETKDSAKTLTVDSLSSIADTTVRTLREPVQEKKRPIAARKKKHVPQLTQEVPARLDSVQAIEIDSVLVADEAARQSENSRLRDLPGYEKGKVYFDSVKIMQAAGLIASGLLFLLLFFLYRRRKKRKGEQQ
jgi:uncharacterized repeat protein (TIGR01451 family)